MIGGHCKFASGWYWTRAVPNGNITTELFAFTRETPPGKDLVMYFLIIGPLWLAVG